MYGQYPGGPFITDETARSGRVAVDKTGADAAEFRTFTGNGRTLREPVLDTEHRQAMLRDLGDAIALEDPWEVISRLYRAGWSYRLIAQFAGMSNEDVRDALISGGRSLAAASQGGGSK